MRKFIPTSEVVEVENYPYGYTARTTLFDSIEFDKKKGYRHVTQTINPKTGLKNKPKKSTYSQFLVRFYDENNHIKTTAFSLNGAKELNRASDFLAENFDLFSQDEIKYLYVTYIAMSKLDMKANVIYCGAKVEDLIPLYDASVKKMVEGANNPTLNLFNEVKLDVDAIKSFEVKDFQPFRVSSH
jgi:hypothetical protein